MKKAEKILILKLGGCIVTFKNQEKPIANTENIKRFAKEINLALQKNHNLKIILIHGAGSFGHPLAKKHNLKLGAKTAEQIRASLESIYLLHNLTNIFLNIFLEEGINVKPIYTSNVTTQKNLCNAKIDINQIKSCLALNIIPILSGSMVFDDKLNFSICSGDVIAKVLAEKFKAELLFATDVDGIFNSDPKINKNAKLFKNISQKNISDINLVDDKSDTSGKMSGKFANISELRGIRTKIFNGDVKDNLLNLLIDDKFNPGTEIFL